MFIHTSESQGHIIKKPSYEYSCQHVIDDVYLDGGSILSCEKEEGGGTFLLRARQAGHSNDCRPKPGKLQQQEPHVFDELLHVHNM